MRAFSGLVLLLALLPLPAVAGPLRITGRIVLPSGTKGARVELHRLATSYEERVRAAQGAPPSPVATAIPGAGGTFELKAPGPGLYRVRVEVDGFLPLETELAPLLEDQDLPPASPVRAATVTVKMPGPKTRVLVFGSSPGEGEPASRWFPAPRETVAEAGTARLSYRAGEVLSLITARPQAVALFAEFRPEGTREIAPGQTVTLEVRGVDDRPVPGALVSLSTFPLTTAGPGGRFTVETPGAGGRLTVEGPGGHSAEVTLDPRSVGPGEVRIARLQPPRVVTGRVLDATTGRPLPGAVIAGLSSWVLADAAGSFRIELPPRPRELYLMASAAGYVGAEWSPEMNGDGPVALSLKRAGGLAGQVVDAQGRPVKQARVHAVPTQSGYGQEDPPEGTVTTGADGGFLIPQLQAGWTYEVIVDGGAFAPASQLADVPAPGQTGTPLRITVAPGATASGRVVDESGQPVPGAMVRLYIGRENGRKTLPDPEGISDAQGGFRLPNLAAGRYDLYIAREGLVPRLVRAVDIPAKTGTIDLGEIRLKAGAAIEGRVTDERGRPLEGAMVVVSVRASSLLPDRWAMDPGNRSRQTRTGPDGSFRLEDLSRGERYDLWIQAAGYVNRQASGVEAPTPEPLRIELRRGRTLAVRVMDPEGSPVPHARLSRMEEIRASTGAGGFGTRSISSVGETDDEGRFRIEGLEPGTLNLQVQAGAYQPKLVRGIRILEDEDPAPLEIVLDRGAVLEGRVLDGEGNPVAGAEIDASPKSHEESFGMLLSATTDGEGHYRLEGLAAGSYEVTAESAELQHRLWASADVDTGIHHLDFRFPAGSPVSGRVVDARGLPVPLARVSLVPVGGGYLSNGVSRADGSFTIQAVPDGDFRLQGAAPGFTETISPEEVRMSGRPVQGLVLRLSPSLSITGRLLGVDPDELTGAYVQAFFRGSEHRFQRLSGVVDGQGKYRVPGAFPGTWQVTALLPDGRSASGTLEVTAEPAVLDLEIETGLTLSGRILVDGEPLAGANVAVDGNQTRTAHDGGFSVPALRPGTHLLTVVLGPGTGHVRKIELTRDEEITVSLSTGGIEGRILSPEGIPVAGTLVEVAAEQQELEAIFQGLQVLTGDDGTFEVSRRIEGTYRLTVHADGFAPAESRTLVSPGGTVHLELMLHPESPDIK